MSTQPLSPEESTKRTWAMLCHLTALAQYIGIPFGHIIGPLIIWLVKKDQMPEVDAHGKESLNFQISMSIYAAVSAILIFVVIGIFLLIAIGILDLIFIIIASVKAYNGEFYRYPLTIRFIK